MAQPNLPSSDPATLVVGAHDADTAQRLRDAEARYQALVLATGQITWSGRSDSGESDVTAWSIFTGQDIVQSGAWGWLDALHPDDRDRAAEAWNTAVTTRRIYEIDYRVRRYDGVYRWLFVRGVPVLNPDGSVREWVGTATDITERKVAEERLHHLQAITADLVTAQTLAEVRDVIVRGIGGALGADAVGLRMVTPAGLMMEDHLSNAQMTAATMGTVAALPLTARHPAAEAARTATAIFITNPREIRRRYPAFAKTAAQHGTQAGAHLPLKRGDTVFGVLSLNFAEPHAWDAAERTFALALADRAAVAYERARLFEAERDTHRRLLATSAILQAVVEHLPVGLALFDRDLRFVHVNQRMAAINHLPPLAQIGRRLSDLVAAGDAVQQSAVALIEASIAEVFATGQGIYDREVTGPTVIDPTDTRHSLASWFPVVVDGTVQMVGAVVLDMTDRVRSEQALRVANHTKDEFLGIASHELRTPLTSAKSNVQLAARRLARLGATPTTDADLIAQLQPLATLLDRSDGALDRLARLVDDLLDVSRIQAGKLELRYQRSDLVGLVHDAVAEEAATSPNRVVQWHGLLAQHHAAPVLCEADPDRIRQVVINYVSNALKYAPPGPPITVDLTVTGSVARVSVRDHGPGLTPDQQANVFEQFYRAEGITHQQGSQLGLGLGLYICRTIIDQHGGAVGVAGAPGEGSTFWFTLPIA